MTLQETIARVIDPDAFRTRDAVVDYRMNIKGDDPETAVALAESMKEIEYRLYSARRRATTIINIMVADRGTLRITEDGAPG